MRLADADVSGADPIETRPGFSALLDRIESNGVRTVLIEDASRRRNMEQLRRKLLTKIAWERLEATAHDDERWNYAWGGEGAGSFSYCPWAAYENEGFWGVTPRMKLPWMARKSEAGLHPLSGPICR